MIELENKLKQIPLKDINFHDCKIYAWGFDSDKNQLLMDIDLIYEWIVTKNNNYVFRVAPTTLVFENVWDVSMDISMDNELIIDKIEYSNPVVPRNIDYLPKETKEYDWKIEFLQGEITFKAISFSIYQRQKEVLQKSQTLTMDDRKDISLRKEGILYQINLK